MSIVADPIAPVILGVTGILFFAVLGRFTARKIGLPSVLGELLMGMLIGNIFYFLGAPFFIVLREGSQVFNVMGHMLAGSSLHEAVPLALGTGDSAKELLQVLKGPHGLDYLKVSHVVDIFSRYGVIFLLFLVGLEISVSDLKETGADSVRVAVIGVVAPMILGFFVVRLFFPELRLAADLFIAATLAATSISITARVLHEMNKTKSQESHVILGAAMLDDILGLIILALVTSMIVTGSIEIRNIVRILAMASLFLVSTLMLGPYILKLLVKLLRQMNVMEAKLFISFLFVMALAWLATIVDLATIVGAFAAGIILHDGYFHYWGDTSNHRYSIKDLVAPLESILAPIFFTLIGIQVKMEAFFDWRVVLLATALILAAMLGKLLCGVGASRGSDRLAIGIGMMPRGEVGLVFASIGKNLGVINDQLFASIILMVVVTTLIAPPLLKYRLVHSSKA